MATILNDLMLERTPHSWLRKINLIYRPGPTTPLLDTVAENMMEMFEELGHTVQEQPDSSTDVVITTATYGQVIGWRRSMMFTGRIQLKIKHSPRAVTIIHMTPKEFDEQIAYFERVLGKEPLDEKDFEFEGLADKAPKVLIEQGLRGGPILALLRVLQSQSKCIRILLVVGEDEPDRVYHFDLVGAHPYTKFEGNEASFYEDVVLRLVTYESTWEITSHEVVGDLVPRADWENSPTIEAMRRAGEEIGERNFFTEMLKISDLTVVPAISDAIATQYSEGCFATWDVDLEGLVATVTGSARPVDKDNITEDDLSLIVGVQENGDGALVREIEGKKNDPPSSEAVELFDMDSELPMISLNGKKVPVIRSKLHGHRGVKAYNPDLVEFIPMGTPYHHYLVSCATEAQARGIKQAFATTESLLDFEDPRQIAFTILPGHGVLIVEKWVEDKLPFQLIWEYMDAGHFQIDNLVPQGPIFYVPGKNGKMVLGENIYF